jgi:arginase
MVSPLEAWHGYFSELHRNMYLQLPRMTKPNKNIQILSAPSILGLKSTGVEKLPESLLAHGLKEKLKSGLPVLTIPTLNHERDPHRDPSSRLLNENKLREFSHILFDSAIETLDRNKFPLVLGGDCSLLIGIMAALRSRGKYGLIFLDAHADFYLPDESTTGEAADMDLALVTGRGPESLTNIHNLKPYVPRDHVFHIGQRDAEEVERFKSQPIQETAMHCFDAEQVHASGVKAVADKVIAEANALQLDGYWIHFDTDVLSDELNPAVDYRLSGGLSFEQVEFLMHLFLNSLPIAGITVTIFNPLLDPTGIISKRIAECLEAAFSE